MIHKKPLLATPYNKIMKNTCEDLFYDGHFKYTCNVLQLKKLQTSNYFSYFEHLNWQFREKLQTVQCCHSLHSRLLSILDQSSRKISLDHA